MWRPGAGASGWGRAGRSGSDVMVVFSGVFAAVPCGVGAAVGLRVLFAAVVAGAGVAGAEATGKGALVPFFGVEVAAAAMALECLAAGAGVETGAAAAVDLECFADGAGVAAATATAVSADGVLVLLASGAGAVVAAVALPCLPEGDGVVAFVITVAAEPALPAGSGVEAGAEVLPCLTDGDGVGVGASAIAVDGLLDGAV